MKTLEWSGPQYMLATIIFIAWEVFVFVINEIISGSDLTPGPLVVVFRQPSRGRQLKLGPDAGREMVQDQGVSSCVLRTPGRSWSLFWESPSPPSTAGQGVQPSFFSPRSPAQ